MSAGKFDEDNLQDIEWADIVVTNNICNYGSNYTARVFGKTKEKGKLFHFDTDALLVNLFPEHKLYGVYKEKGLEDITKFIYSHSDLVSVTQIKFANRVSQYCNGLLAVVKNAIDYNLECWNAPKFQSPRKNLVRIGWAGGIHHSHDVKEFLGVPQMVNQRVGRENVHWGFYGKPPLDPNINKKTDTQHITWEEYRQ